MATFTARAMRTTNGGANACKTDWPPSCQG